MALAPIKVVIQAKDEASATINKLGSGIKNMLVGMGAAISAIAIGEFVASSVQAFGELQNSMAQVAQSLKNVGENAIAITPGLRTMFEAIANKTGVKVKDIADAYAQLVARTGSSAEATKLLMPVLDVAAAKHMEVGMAVRTVANAHDGLKKAIRQTMNTQGAAEAQGKTVIGTLGRMSNAYVTLKEHLGEALTQTDGFGDSTNALQGILIKLTSFIDNHAGDIARFTNGFAKFVSFLLDDAFPAVGRFFEKCSTVIQSVVLDVQIAQRQIEWAYLKLEEAHAKWEAFIHFGDTSKMWEHMAQGFAQEINAVNYELDQLKLKYDHLWDKKPDGLTHQLIAEPDGSTPPDNGVDIDQKAKRDKAAREAEKELERVLKAQHDLRTKGKGGLNNTGTGNAGVDAANRAGAGITQTQAASQEDINATHLKNLTDAQKKHNDEMQKGRDIVNQYGQAWIAAFQAMGSGGNMFKQLEKAAIQTISNIAAKKGQEQFAEGAADLAAGIHDPTRIVSGLKHIAAGVLFEALAGASARASSGGGGGGGTSQAGGNATTQMGAQGMSTGTIIIKGDRYLDTNNPSVMNAFVNAIQNVKDKNHIVISFQP